MQNKLKKKKEKKRGRGDNLAWWETIWYGEGRGGIRDKQTNLDKGSSGESAWGAARSAVGCRQPCLRGGLAKYRP